jgi:cell division protein FtsW
MTASTLPVPSTAAVTARSRFASWFASAPRGRPDIWLLLTTLVLTIFGLVMVYSSSAVVISDRTGDPFYYLERQAAAVVLGLVGMAILARVPTTTLMRWGPAFYFACLLGLCLVLVPALGHAANGAARWIGFGSIHVQPSEFCKLALVVVLADRVSRYPGGVRSIRRVLGPVFLLTMPALVLVIAEPDFGTTAILTGILGMVLFLAGLPIRWIVTLGSACLALSIPAIALSSYRLNRFLSWLDPWSVEQGDGYQVIQSWVALHTGGLTGQGLGNSLAKLHFLPEPWTDFIAAVIGEELGFLGILVLLVAYGFFAWRGVRIAQRARTLFGSLVAGCITAVLGLQAVLNIGVVTGMVPPKGLVLPFVSYGSSAILAQLWAVGILLSISTETVEALDAPGVRRTDLVPVYDPPVRVLPAQAATDGARS